MMGCFHQMTVYIKNEAFVLKNDYICVCEEIDYIYNIIHTYIYIYKVIFNGLSTKSWWVKLLL